MLARALAQQGKLAEAEAMLRELYKGRIANRGGRQTAAVQWTRRALAEVLVKQDRVDEALALWDESPGKSTPDAAAAVAAILLPMEGGPARAEALLRRAAGDAAEQTTVASAGIESVRSVLAVCLARRGEFDTAKSLARHAAGALQHDRTARRIGQAAVAQRALIEVLELSGETEEAAALRSKVPSRSPAAANPDFENAMDGDNEP